MTKKHLLSSVLIIVVAIVILLGMGRVPFCKCGVISMWSSDTTSNEQSQQLFDPYTFTHIIHGIIFYLLLWLIFGKRLNGAQRLVLAIGLESAWEIIENTPFVLDRYRAVTVSYGYYGDSVFNSIGDILAMAFGFIMAWKLPRLATALIVIAIELLLLYFIHDNLTINIIMLVHPIDAIKTWQAGMQ